MNICFASAVHKFPYESAKVQQGCLKGTSNLPSGFPPNTAKLNRGWRKELSQHPVVIRYGLSNIPRVCLHYASKLRLRILLLILEGSFKIRPSSWNCVFVGVCFRFLLQTGLRTTRRNFVYKHATWTTTSRFIHNEKRSRHNMEHLKTMRPSIQ